MKDTILSILVSALIILGFLYKASVNDRNMIRRCLTDSRKMYHEEIKHRKLVEDSLYHCRLMHQQEWERFLQKTK